MARQETNGILGPSVTDLGKQMLQQGNETFRNFMKKVLTLEPAKREELNSKLQVLAEEYSDSLRDCAKKLHDLSYRLMKETKDAQRAVKETADKLHESSRILRKKQSEVNDTSTTIVTCIRENAIKVRRVLDVLRSRNDPNAEEVRKLAQDTNNDGVRVAGLLMREILHSLR